MLKQEELTYVSDHWLKSLAKQCEKLIGENRAGLEEYELYVRCQYELARRKAAPQRFQPARPEAFFQGD